MGTSLKLIVGLGNPGPQYLQTRHNAGEWLVIELARRYGGTLKADPKYFGATAKIHIDNNPIWLLVPDTFMNRSGKAVAALANFYKIDVKEILVAHDELDIPPGTARFKQDGGHGGHNGLRDIIQCLANRRDFHRARIGIGHPGSAGEVTNYVLGKAAPEDQQHIDAAVDACADALPQLVVGDAEAAMRQLHSFKA